MASPPTRIPPREHAESVAGFCREALEEGEAFLKSQPNYSKIDQLMKTVISAPDISDVRPAGLSVAKSNRLGKIGADLAALMTDIKPFWEYKTHNPAFEPQQVIYGKLSTSWYLDRQTDVRFADVVKYWVVSGTGWAHQKWNPRIQDIELEAEDPRDVLPIRPSSNAGTIQDAFGVIVRRQRTVNYLKALYPEKADLIRADSDGSSVTAALSSRLSSLLDSIMSPFHAALQAEKAKNDIPRIPTATLYTMYIDDPSIHKGRFPVVMGEVDEQGKPANDWSYVVYPGEPLYPRKRLIVFTRTSPEPLYDGPSIYWHGMFPLSKLTLDPWPWSWLGKSPLVDLMPLQRAIDRCMRAIDDWLAKVVEPDVIADKNSVPRAVLERWNTRRPGGKYTHNPIAGKGMQLQYPTTGIEIAFKFFELLINEMDTLPGVRDLSQMMQLNQIPSAESMDKIIQSMTPSVRSRSRMVEAFMRDFAMQLAYNFSQFYTQKRRLLLLGQQGVTQDDFDFDPGTLIPAVVGDGDMMGPRPRYERTREFLRQFTFHVAPGSMLAASEIERKLMYLQLARAGWMDIWTLAEVFDIPNFGQPPGIPDPMNPGVMRPPTTVTERLMVQQMMGLAGTPSPAGRKASGQDLPRVVTKESS